MILDTARQLHIERHSSKVGYICKNYAGTKETNSQHRERSWAHNLTYSHEAIDNCHLLRKGKTVFSKSMAQVSQPCSNGRPHIQEYLNRTIWS